eukprot:COSAG04_NODE_9201_length_887_cov_2.519036_1_plen_295_part_11
MGKRTHQLVRAVLGVRLEDTIAPTAPHVYRAQAGRHPLKARTRHPTATRHHARVVSTCRVALVTRAVVGSTGLSRVIRIQAVGLVRLGKRTPHRVRAVLGVPLDGTIGTIGSTVSVVRVVRHLHRAQTHHRTATRSLARAVNTCPGPHATHAAAGSTSPRPATRTRAVTLVRLARRTRHLVLVAAGVRQGVMIEVIEPRVYRVRAARHLHRARTRHLTATHGANAVVACRSAAVEMQTLRLPAERAAHQVALTPVPAASTSLAAPAIRALPGGTRTHRAIPPRAAYLVRPAVRTH